MSLTYTRAGYLLSVLHDKVYICAVDKSYEGTYHGAATYFCMRTRLSCVHWRGAHDHTLERQDETVVRAMVPFCPKTSKLDPGIRETDLSFYRGKDVLIYIWNQITEILFLPCFPSTTFISF